MSTRITITLLIAATVCALPPQVHAATRIPSAPVAVVARVDLLSDNGTVGTFRQVAQAGVAVTSVVPAPALSAKTLPVTRPPQSFVLSGGDIHSANFVLAWRRDFETRGTGAYRSVVIILRDAGGQELERFSLTAARPIKVASAMQSGIYLDAVEITCDSYAVSK